MNTNSFILALMLLAGIVIAERSFADNNNTKEIVNIAPYAEITTNPFCGMLHYLTDGDMPVARGSLKNESTPYEAIEVKSDGTIDTFICFPPRSSKQKIFFKFPVPVPIKKIRFFQRQAYSKNFILEADTDGDGNFETLIKQMAGKPDAWNTIFLEKFLTVKAIRFTSLQKEGRGAPQISEFQIYSKSESAGGLQGANEIKKENKNVKKIKFKDSKNFGEMPKLPKEMKYQFGTCATLFMFIDFHQPYEKNEERYNIGLESMKELDMDRIKLFVKLGPKSLKKVTFPTDPEYLSRIYPSDVSKTPRYKGIAFHCMPWPSKVMIGYKENVLKRFLKNAKQCGISASVMPPRNQPPFDVRPGCYPQAQADLHDKKADPRFPCVWHGGYWKPAFKKILNEIIDCGPKGIEIVPDEFYIQGHNLQRMPKDDPCRRLFKGKYGIEVPKYISDTEAYRKWVLFQYNSTANTFKALLVSAKKHKPDIHTETNLSVAPLIFYNSPEFTLAYDIVGHMAGYDSFGTDPYFGRPDTLAHYQIPKTCEIFKGATPSRNTSMLLQAVCTDWKTPLKDPIWISGNATSTLMHGVNEIDFYRLDNYAPCYPTKSKKQTTFFFIKKWIRMIRAMEKLGLKAASPVKDIAFIYSRAGIDWWELKEIVKAQKKEKKKKFYPNSAMAGYSHHDAVMEIFFKNGHFFDLYYLDQPSTLDKALDYKVIVLPFAYSMSEEAFDIIKKANEKGVAILIINKKGETNEFGNKYSKPLLEKLIGKSGVEYINIDLLEKGNSPQTRKKILGAINKLLGDKKTLHVNTRNKDVEIGFKENEKIKFISIINWENKPMTIDLGLELSDGQYEISQYSLAGIAKSIEKTYSNVDLKNFQLEVPSHKTFILTVKKYEN